VDSSLPVASPTTAPNTSWQAWPCLPPLHDGTADEALTWFQELAGSQPLSLLAQRMPWMRGPEQLLHALWNAAVPYPRALWCAKMLHLHWATTQLASNSRGLCVQPSGGSSSIPGAAALAAGGPKGLDLRPEANARCAALWTSTLLRHVEHLLSAAAADVAAEAQQGAIQSKSRAQQHRSANLSSTGSTRARKAGAGRKGQLFSSGSLNSTTEADGTAMQPHALWGDASNVPGAKQAGGESSGVAPQVLLPPAPSELDSVAAAAMAETAALFLQPGMDVQLQYFVGLACHSFEEGESAQAAMGCGWWWLPLWLSDSRGPAVPQ
jgi:hypothetical protein